MDNLTSLDNPLSRGFYTVSEAACLIEVGSARRILSWLRGNPGRAVKPLLYRDYSPVNGQEELSFLDLMEIRFVEHFREQGVKTKTLRRALEVARSLFNTQKPFASRRIRFVPRDDRKDIFVEEVLKPTAEQTGDPCLWSLTTKQYEIYALIQEKLARGVMFDPETDLAVRWVPRPERFPDVVVDPRIAYGKPVGPSLIPTYTLYQSWTAEGRDIDAVADWYGVRIHEAQMAVDFEIALTDLKMEIPA